MCGIHGGYAFSGAANLSVEVLEAMGMVTQHRGPDDSGTFLDGPAAIGMRRLSIIDLEGGHQPIFNEDQSIAVVCNGEIYNFRELREKLIAKGHQFSTHSDSEVTVHLYEEYGIDFLSHLNGMFALALWDRNRQRLIIARDRLGIKPLYYYRDDNVLLFSTEAKAIFETSHISPKLDKTACGLYVQLGYVPAPWSIYENVKKLPVASCMIIEQGQTRIHEYWRPDYTQKEMSEAEWKRAVLEQLEQSVASQMVSDVPFGAFLSGGIDSSLVVGLMAKHSREPVRTYAIGFDTEGAGQLYNELPYAKQVSELFSTQHKEIIVKPDVVHLLPKLLWHMDEPIADTAFITTYLVSEFARQDVTMILSGVGGDELFGGYRRYQGEYYQRYYNMIPAWLRKYVLSPVANALPSDRHSKWLNYSRLAKSFILTAELPLDKRYQSYINIVSDAMRAELLKGGVETLPTPVIDLFAKQGSLPALHSMFEVDRLTQLPDDLLMLTDKMTMATSLECRVPLLDHELVELACQMPSELKIKGGVLKYILKESLTELLPREILYRKKRGFGAPMGAWIKRELLPLMKGLLSVEQVESRGVFNGQVVQGLINDHLSNKSDNTDILIGLLNFEIWSKMMLDGQAPQEVESQLERMSR
ncbi:asparagine synthase [Oleiphilus messinensis]|uniref:asparagine synthase (glutamine-hydrolyzing) n=1 Tax=Oleiphilus messinensis TaxID=141451 RepID=A0A1Y0I7J8_9GAMM|nr:asparagine synthase (glutamine-hydrolyzing) [Oleiphilus messinensis]ARU56169.1 asparagine synthase [Oleiphilus messinensis]